MKLKNGNKKKEYKKKNQKVGGFQVFAIIVCFVEWKLQSNTKLSNK